jgi:predicted O-linked N-acetylglucosamine transferase (SPINDLY family)/ADP-heptose:LPS heptosyltransferase
MNTKNNITPSQNSTVSSSANPDKFQHAFQLHQQGQLDQAEQLYLELLKEQPQHVDALHFLGVLLNQRGQFQHAADLIRQALDIAPDNAAAYSNLGLVLLELKRFDEAIASYDRALILKSNNLEAHYGRANALLALNRFDEALVSYKNVLNINPDYVDAHWGLSWCYLSLGDYDNGWKEYEWRQKTDDFKNNVRNFPQPQWFGGESLREKTIFLHNDEQGLGDTLQFCRYTKQLADLGARVILEVPTPLLRLLSKLEGVDQLVIQGSVLPAFDFHCPLLSLPLAFKTRLDSIPVNNPYLFSESDKVKHWQAVLGERTRPRVGLVWSGNPAHKNDQNRSIALHELLPLITAQCQFISLQKEVRDTDKQLLGQQPLLQHYGEQINDFADTAALCALMDVVISVDTSVAHLAAAMGKPTWIILPHHNSDWRWLLNRDDSPWYPTVRLFRQKRHADWRDVIEQLQRELIKLPTLDQAAIAVSQQSQPIQYEVDLFPQAFALHRQEQIEQAEVLYEALLKQQPQHVDALHFLGVLLNQRGQSQRAVDLISQALKINSDNAAAHSNLGLALHALKRYEEAIASYDKVLNIKPDNAEAYYNRGNSLLALNHLEQALTDFDRALAIKPNYIEALSNRGITLRELRRFDEALDNYKRILMIKPDSAEAEHGCGVILQDLKRYSEAVTHYGRALDLKPDLEFIFGTRLYLKMNICDWSEFDQHLSRVALGIERDENIAIPFSLLAIISSASVQKKVACCYSKTKYPSALLLPPIAKHTHAKIRIAYFSADFRHHPVSYLTAELFERHDRSRFEIIAFSLHVAEHKDDMRLRLEKAFDQFIDVSQQSDEQVVRLARELKIDIAVDLNGNTEGCRTGIFAMRAAPIQVGYLGYAGTMGAEYMDYLLADSVVIPTKYQHYYTEKIAYLPNSFMVNDSTRAISDRQFSRTELGLPEQGFVFCCFNNAYKILPTMFDIWMRLLHQVEDSVLWLVESHAEAVNNLQREAIKRGIAAERLIFAQRLPLLSDHLARHRLADLFLDTLPYNAHTTAIDSLWAGLPVLTCTDEAFASRVAASLLNAIGLPELITDNLQDYEALAVQLATHPEQLAAMKQKLADNRLSYPLFDTVLFTRHIESAYQTMFERYQAGLAPDYIYVSAQNEATKKQSVRFNPLSLLGKITNLTKSRKNKITEPAQTEIEQFEEARKLHEQGQLAAAETLYEEVLKIQPDHTEALRSLAAIRKQRKPINNAVTPQVANKNSDSVLTHLNKGLELQNRNRLHEALLSYDSALAIDANHIEVLINRGNVLEDLERLNEALACYDRVLSNHPNHAKGHSNRGNVLQSLKRYDEAIASYDRALSIKPDYAEAFYNRGNALLAIQRLPEALASYDRALQIKSDFIQALISRGNALHDAQRFSDALLSYNRALDIQPDYAEALYNRGNVLIDLKRLDEALADYKHALSIKPDYAEALVGCGVILQELKRTNEARISYERALAIKPDLEFTFGDWLYMKMNSCDWDKLDQHLIQLTEGIRLGKKMAVPFFVHSVTASAALQQKAASCYVTAKYPDRFQLPALVKHSHAKIRLGYFSADFRHHPVAYLTAELFERHDRSRFEVIAFSCHATRHKDDMRLRLEAAFDQFIDVSQQTDEQIVQLARQLEIDIAIDLTGFTKGCRSNLFAMRVAPVQVNYLGFSGTMGAKYMDYLLADAVIIPTEYQSCYTENIAYLPNSYMVNDSTRAISNTSFSRSAFGLPEQGFVFCCFNNAYKITPAVFAIWMRLLHQVEGSVLWLSEPGNDAINNLRFEANKQGIAAERLIFAKRLPLLADHLARHRLADLFLDTLPYNAHTTSSDALWAGLPVLTCMGEAFASRVAASLLTAIGLPELITSTGEDYEALAIKLATHPELLATIKQKLADNRLTCPLFNTVLFTQHIESAYQTMFERYQTGLPAVQFYVPAQTTESNEADALINQGNELEDSGRLEAALASYDHAIAINPNHARAYSNRGNVLQSLNRFAEALQSYDRALVIKPDYAEAFYNRGNTLQALERPDEALNSYDKALAIKPDLVVALIGRGNVLQDLKRFAEALESYDRVLAIQPDYLAILISCGSVLQSLKRYDEALACYDRALNIQPDYVEALADRGAVLQTLKRFDEAIASYDRTLAIKPDYAEVWAYRAVALQTLGRLDETISSCERALAINPKHEFLFGIWLHTKMKICDWQDFDNNLNNLNQKIIQGEKAITPFAVQALFSSPSVQKASAEIYARAKYPSVSLLPPLAKHRHSKIRLGYFSSDFRNHPVAHLTIELFERHDRSRFEVIAFSFHAASYKDDTRLKLEAVFDQFIDVSQQSDEQVARLVRDMEIDIAIDLNGFTDGCRTGIFAMRAAPVQLSYLGYLGTMGTDYMDYLLADPTLIPVEHQVYYHEKIAYLPHSFQINDSKQPIVDKTFTRAELDLPEQSFVFCCFNNNFKITPVIFDVWMRILHQVPGSVLWLLADNNSAKTNLLLAATARGIAAERLIFAKRLPLSEHLARHRNADLFLDTQPYNAGATASAALWAGLPVLTYLGETFAGRMAASLLTAIDLPELIANSLEDYEALAIQLATQPEQLAVIKQKLANNRLSTPLFDTALLTQHIEAAYQTIFNRYQADLAPDHIYVSAEVDTIKPIADTNELDALIDQGNELEDLNRSEEALACYDRAIAINPDYARAHSNRGNVLQNLKRFDEALESYDRALSIRPDYAEAHYNRGNALQACKRYQEAITSYERALSIKPDFIQALISLGNVLHDCNRYVEALSSYDRALTIQPDYAEAFYNRGNVLHDLKRYDEAIVSYNRALTIKPDYAGAHWNSSFCHLILGDFETGWKEYEWRWKSDDSRYLGRNFSKPQWFGEESLQGKTILLHGEQGFGDTLHFCRYAKQVADLGARVILEAQQPLLPLLATLDGVDQLVAQGSPLPDFDCHCPLLSLPLAFKTRLDSIPVNNPYLFSEPDQVKHWQKILGEKTLPRVGLVWSGGTAQKNDHNRSFALRELLPLLTSPLECQFISLQKELRDADKELLAQQPVLQYYGDQINDFADTAALCELMDVVISVCTSVAHLSAALGKPTWILLSDNACWRWLLNRDDSPWYPTVRLFRQTQHGDWQNVIERVSHELISVHDQTAKLQTNTEKLQNSANKLQQAVSLHQQGQLADAEILYKEILQTQPQQADALHLLGAIAKQRGQAQIAVDLISQSLKINPNNAAAHSNIALAFQALNRFDDALASYDNALAIQPDYAEALFNQGITLQCLDRFDEAIDSYDRALAIQPEHAETAFNKGVALEHFKRFNEAIASYEYAFTIQPDCAKAHWNSGLCRLLLGDFDTGWKEYEWRWKTDESKNILVKFSKPQWFGEETLQDKTILLHSEQGLGDTIQFCRYAKLVADLGARVILEVQKPLLRLLTNLEGIDQLVVRDSPLPDFDLHCPLLSLPLAFKTRLDSIPANNPYLFSEPDKVKHWQKILGEKTLPRVGLVWAGSSTHQNDHNRSLTLQELLPLLTPHCHYVSLQKDLRDQDAELLAEQPILQHYGEQLNDFTDTAALCELMDIVISVDTSVAHLAAAMGKPTWILLPFIPDWRWLLSRDDSPWYPAVRLFRQTQHGDWQSVIERVSHELHKLIGINVPVNRNSVLTNSAETIETLINQGKVLSSPGRYERALTIADKIDNAYPAQQHRELPYTNTATFLQAFELHQQGDFVQAEALYKATLQEQPQHAEALHLLGVLASQRGQAQLAIDLISQSLRINPDNAVAHSNIGLAFHALNRLDEALASHERALTLEPDYADALYNRGNVLLACQQFDLALNSYDKALSIQPDYVEALCNRGIVLQKQNRLDEALASYERALAIKSDYAEVLTNRGNVLKDLKRWNEAINSYEQALAINAGDLETLINHGNLLQELGRYDEALASYDRALVINPDYTDALCHQGIVLQDLNRWYEALACYERALSIDPDHEFLFGSFLSLKMKICDWSDFESNSAQLKQKIANGKKTITPFAILAQSSAAALQKTVASCYSTTKYPNNFLSPPLAKHAHSKIKVAYFSADFHQHATAHLMAGLFEHHNKLRFEFIAFSFLAVDNADDMRSRLVAAFDQFIDVSQHSDEQVVRLARELEIDIAIDLKGYTQHARTELFAMRVAPIQVSYLGYPGTMGADYMDYLIADTVLIPKIYQPYYTEKIVYLPDSYQANDSTRPIADQQFTRAECGLPEQGFVFCCFNNNYKITPAFFDIWMRLLHQVNDSVLWLLSDNSAAETNLRLAATARGIATERLVFAQRMPLPEHLARHRLADLFLDTLPCNAHTTTSDALWAGLPVLTCMGEAFASRVAASLLTAIGLPELITSNTEDYEALAYQLATQPEQLAALKQKLADHRLTYPLFDTALFTQHIEAAYQAMYDRYQAGLAPAHIDVPSVAHPTPPSSANADKFAEAMRLHQQGQLAAAETLYEKILQSEPQHIDVLHFLGVLKNQHGQPETAIDLIRQAIRLHPDYAAAYSNLGTILQGLNRFDEAVDCYAQVLRLTPNDMEMLLTQGNLLLALNRPEQALIHYDKALLIKPDAVDILLSRATALQMLDRFADALIDYNHILTIDTNHAEAWFGHANVLYQSKRLAEAISSYDRSLAINPNSPEAFYNRGITLHDLGRIDEAISSYQQALAIKPDYVEGYNNLATLLKKQDRFAEAEACYRQAIAIKPDYVEAYCNLVTFLKDQGQLAEAEKTLNSALAIIPDNAELRILQLIMTLPMVPQTATESALVPEQFDRALTEFSDWLACSASHQDSLTKATLLPLPFLLAYRVGNHVQRLSRYGDLVAFSDKAAIAQVTRKKLKMIVVSHHFRRHSVWDVITRGLLVNLDRSRFELVLYHLGNIEDQETAFAKSLADEWRDTHTMLNLNDWLTALNHDAPDIIFYPEIGMDPMSARLASHRIAALQISSWGHPITTGFPHIDLYFSGELLESPDADAHYRERLIRLPGTGCCTTPMNIHSESLLPELATELTKRSGTRFIIAQTIYKFDPVDDGLYADIASVVGDSIFLLLRDRENAWVMDQIVARLEQTFLDRGLNPEQHLLVIPWQSMERFQSLLDECDVYLDCPSFSGYTTAWQAVHRGLPIVTLEGEFMRQRLAAGLLRKIGITDTIASSREQYIQLAVKLAAECQNPVQRAARRTALKNAAPKADNDISVVKAFEQQILKAFAEGK